MTIVIYVKGGMHTLKPCEIYPIYVFLHPFVFTGGCWGLIQLLESPIPVSQKASSDDISGTKRGTIDPLVSKQTEKILNKKIKKN